MAKQKFHFNAINDTFSNPTANNVPGVGKENNSEKFEIKIIPRHKIRTNEMNTYNVSDIEHLMDSILNFGLLQNLLAIYSLEDDVYILEAGHRRVTALDMLIKRFSVPNAESLEDYQLYRKNVSMYETGYPVKVSGNFEDKVIYNIDNESLENISDLMLESEIRLHITNQDIRKESPADRAKNIQRFSKLLNERNRRLHKTDRVNVNETIGEQLGITKRQVADIKATEKLIPELQKKFELGDLTLKNAASYARLDEGEQKVVNTMIENGDSISAKEIAAIKKENRSLTLPIKNRVNGNENQKEKIPTMNKPSEAIENTISRNEKNQESLSIDEIITGLYKYALDLNGYFSSNAGIKMTTDQKEKIDNTIKLLIY
jgi:hypothetical protein